MTSGVLMGCIVDPFVRNTCGLWCVLVVCLPHAVTTIGDVLLCCRREGRAAVFGLCPVIDLWRAEWCIAVYGEVSPPLLEGRTCVLALIASVGYSLPSVSLGVC